MRFLLAVFIAICLSACLSEPDCIVTATSYAKISFQQTVTDKITFQKKDTAKAVSFASITVAHTDQEFATATAITSIALPVYPFDSVTTFKFIYPLATDPVTNRTDSIVVKYVKQNIIVSPTCGVFTFYSGLSIVSSSFPSDVTIVNPQLFNSVTSNIKVKL